ncbi:hypothetical protein LEMLEM_LOCUS25272 [Lemmus lemmus]
MEKAFRREPKPGGGKQESFKESQSGRLRANGSSAGPTSPAPRLRTSLPGHGPCRYRVLELSAGCRSQLLPSTVRAGRSQVSGRRRAA